MATGRVPTTANSPLTAKGDLFGYSTTQARVAVGSNGDTLVADSAATTGLRWQGNFAAGKNKIINGDFNIWQRGTSFTPTSGTFSADRFYTVFDGTGSTRNISRQTFTPGTAPVAGYEGTYFLRYATTVAGTGGTYSTLSQNIEDVRTFAGQTATFSFWAKAASSITLPAVYAVQRFGSGGSTETITLIASNVAVTTSWQRFSYTFTVPSVSGKTIGTGSYLDMEFYTPLNSTYTLDTWGWQLEAGSVATAFQTATGTLQGELAACQRYYIRYASTEIYGKYGLGYAYSTTVASIFIPNPVTMRVKPTAIEYSNLGLTIENTSTTALTNLVIIAGSNNQPINVAATVASGLTTNRPYELSNNNSASGYVGFSAEL